MRIAFVIGTQCGSTLRAVGKGGTTRVYKIKATRRTKRYDIVGYHVSERNMKWNPAHTHFIVELSIKGSMYQFQLKQDDVERVA